MSLSKAKKKLDIVFSQFVRLRDSNDDGYGSCYTCGRIRFWKSADAGHFITRGKLSTRWHEQNVRLQCKQCNMTGGRSYEFGKNLDEEFGSGTADGILAESNKVKKWSVYELESMIRHYKKQVEGFKASKRVE